MDFLKNIAKDIGSEFTQLASEINENESYVDTGSYIFNALVSGSIFGGLSGNKITAIAGESSTGKTYFALAVVKNFLDQNPDGGVVYFCLAGKRLVGLGHHEGGAAHAFDAAGNRQVRLAHANGAGRLDGGFHARSAQPVDGGAAGFHRDAGQQARHTGDVPAVLARLVGIAEIDIVHLCPVDRRVTVHQRLDRHCAEVVGANPAQTAAIAADGCADGVTDESVRHVFESLFQKDAHCCR